MDSGEDTACAVGCPIRKSTDQSLLAAPHGLSQRAASFIASQCQGIHQMPFRRLILNSAVAPRAGTSPDARTTPQDALTIEPTPEGAGPRSVLGHLTIVFTLSMIPLQSPRQEEPEAHVSVLRFLLTDLCRNIRSQPQGLDTRRLVEADGIEPTTSCLQSRRSPN